MTTPDTLLGAVANAIATADVDGATYEDLARAAINGYTERSLSNRLKIVWVEESGEITPDWWQRVKLGFSRNNDQEDDGA